MPRSRLSRIHQLSSPRNNEARQTVDLVLDGITAKIADRLQQRESGVLISAAAAQLSKENLREESSVNGSRSSEALSPLLRSWIDEVSCPF